MAAYTRKEVTLGIAHDGQRSAPILTGERMTESQEIRDRYIPMGRRTPASLRGTGHRGTGGTP